MVIVRKEKVDGNGRQIVAEPLNKHAVVILFVNTMFTSF